MPRKDRSPSSRQNTPLVLLAVVSLPAAGVALALLFASQPPGNDSAEAGFAQDMIVHHAQAVQMAEIIRDKTKSDSMRLLALDISLTQQGQKIGIMLGWLQVWGLRVTGLEPAMAWMGHPGDGLMPGMATPDGLDRLFRLPPDRADVLFLRLMISHHEAAIPMAKAILKPTDEPEVSHLASSIIGSQKADIENMQAMVDREVGDSAQVPLQAANGSGTTGTATLSKARGGGVKVVLEVSGLPSSGTM